jgi:hypothetical protein
MGQSVTVFFVDKKSRQVKAQWKREWEGEASAELRWGQASSLSGGLGSPPYTIDSHAIARRLLLCRDEPDGSGNGKGEASLSIESRFLLCPLSRIRSTPYKDGSTLAIVVLI